MVGTWRPADGELARHCCTLSTAPFAYAGHYLHEGCIAVAHPQLRRESPWSPAEPVCTSAWPVARSSPSATSSCCVPGSGTATTNAPTWMSTTAASPRSCSNASSAGPATIRYSDHLLWTGPYSAERRGILATHIDPEQLEECVGHLEALDEARLRPVNQHRGDIVGRLSLFLSCLARAVARDEGGGASGGDPSGRRQCDAHDGGDAANTAGRSPSSPTTAPRARLSGPALQVRDRPAADGVPGPAPRRGGGRAAAAHRPADQPDRRVGGLAGPELLRAPVQGALRA